MQYQNELLTLDEAAARLRTTKKAVYGLVERGAIPGVVHFGRRVLFNRSKLRRHLGLTTTPPPASLDELAFRAGSERDQ